MPTRCGETPSDRGDFSRKAPRADGFSKAPESEAEMRAVRRPIRALLLIVALANAGCGESAKAPVFVGHWTSRPQQHNESKEAVEFFGEGAAQRLNDLGNALTPPVDLELKPSGMFVARGRLTPDGDDSGHAWGMWKKEAAGVRLAVQGSEGAPGLSSTLVLPAEGVSLTWGKVAPKGGAESEGDSDDQVRLFRE